VLQQYCGGKVGLSYPAGHAVEQRLHRIVQQPLRKECLNRNHWTTLREARVVIGDFKRDHNRRHRHSALGYLTPAEYAGVCRHTGSD
jgi:putative transposase